MSEDEMLKNIRKQVENTRKANECGLSNNDFKEDIEALELLHDRYLKEKEKNKELEEQLRKANEYIRNEMYIDDNPTICGDEEDTITELPISLNLYDEDLRELLKLLEERN